MGIKGFEEADSAIEELGWKPNVVAAEDGLRIAVEPVARPRRANAAAPPRAMDRGET